MHSDWIDAHTLFDRREFEKGSSRQAHPECFDRSDWIAVRFWFPFIALEHKWKKWLVAVVCVCLLFFYIFQLNILFACAQCFFLFLGSWYLFYRDAYHQQYSMAYSQDDQIDGPMIVSLSSLIIVKAVWVWQFQRLNFL